MKLIANLSEIDRQATAQYGILAADLMERAGAAVAKLVQTLCDDQSARIVIAAGPGNNGGDGFVVTRLLQRAGYTQVSVVYAGADYKGESLANFETLMGLPVEMIDARAQTALALGKLSHAEVVVDALFGSGLNRDVTGLEADLIAAINGGRGRVVAVDMPSGVDSAKGTIRGVAVQAGKTVTLVASKPGLYLYPGKSCAGKVHVADIGIPDRLVFEALAELDLIDPLLAYSWLPERPEDAHKYDFGHLLVIAGSRNMPGAAALCAESALASGAGLVTLAAPESVFSRMSLAPELMRLPLPETEAGCLDREAVSVVLEALNKKKFNAVALGPGLSHSPATRGFVEALLADLPKELALVIDADGLNILAELPESAYSALGQRAVLTPHVGEAVRLVGCDKDAVVADLAGTARYLARRYACTAVLKSATTIIAESAGDQRFQHTWISPTGSSALAKAGSGDVLAGLMGGLLAQYQAQQKPFFCEAAALAVYLHGLAGQFAEKKLTAYSSQAGRLKEFFPQAFEEVFWGRFTESPD